MESSNFKAAVSFVLSHEGGYVCHRADPGGATNYGISLRFLEEAKIDVDGDGRITPSDIRRITKEQAINIYKKHWWDKYKYEQLVNLQIAAKALDLAVWMGSYRAATILQSAANRLNNKSITVDGLLGPQSMALLNSSDSVKLLEEVCKEAEHFIVNLLADRPELSVFKRGWLRRCLTRIK